LLENIVNAGFEVHRWRDFLQDAGFEAIEAVFDDGFVCSSQFRAL